MPGALVIQLFVLRQKSTECLVSRDAAAAKGEQAGGAAPRAEVRFHASGAYANPSEQPASTHVPHPDCSG